MARLKLLVLLILASGTPAVAGNAGAQKHGHCPHQAALAAARERAHAAAVAQAFRVPRGPTRVTLTERAPSGRWLFGFDSVSRALTP